MITHLNGKLIEKTPTYVVIDVNGIGYKVKISLQTFSSITDGESCKLYTHLSIKEDSHTLFGFFDQISSGDVSAVKSVKGIGAKTAQRIIIDLQDKLSKGLSKTDVLFNKMDNTIKEEALSALLALGFTKRGAEEKIEKVLKINSEVLSVEELVKTALSQW